MLRISMLTKVYKRKKKMLRYDSKSWKFQVSKLQTIIIIFKIYLFSWTVKGCQDLLTIDWWPVVIMKTAFLKVLIALPLLRRRQIKCL